MTERETLYFLYNIFGRGKVTEEQFAIMYIKGELGDWIRLQLKEMEHDKSDM